MDYSQQPSPIELLYLSMANDYVETQFQRELVIEEIESIWLPIFRNKDNFLLALECLLLSEPEPFCEYQCRFYLNVLKGEI